MKAGGVRGQAPCATVVAEAARRTKTETAETKNAEAARKKEENAAQKNDGIAKQLGRNDVEGIIYTMCSFPFVSLPGVYVVGRPP